MNLEPSGQGKNKSVMQLEIICKDLWGLVEALLWSLSYQRTGRKEKKKTKTKKKKVKKTLLVKMMKVTLINTKAKKTKKVLFISSVFLFFCFSFFL